MEEKEIDIKKEQNNKKIIIQQQKKRKTVNCKLYKFSACGPMLGRHYIFPHD